MVLYSKTSSYSLVITQFSSLDDASCDKRLKPYAAQMTEASQRDDKRITWYCT
jgi:hypothetical protein